MAISEQKKKEYVRRLLMSRMRILCNNGFYGMLLLHAVFGLDETLGTAATDGQHIRFDPKFLETLSDSELDFVMMHEILHIVLKHCERTGDRNPEAFNIACDIVVNSNILKSNNMDEKSISLQGYGALMHQTPDGQEGFNFTAEEVYEMLVKKPLRNGKSKFGKNWDNHSSWGQGGRPSDNAPNSDEWEKYFEDACQTMEFRDPDNLRGLLPACAQRVLSELRNPQTDWRQMLTEFVQEDVVDYSFTPPDRRFDDCPFFLPDFNEKDSSVANILFMIDTSASMSDKMVDAAFSEVRGAIDQFDGRVKGWVGFFDAQVYDVVPFENGLPTISAKGRGGTDFLPVFKYVQNNMTTLPASIIVLTDGYAPFPKQSEALGIPVLWLLNNKKVVPPWGKVARISV